MHANYDHERLIDYIEGELPPEQMARVDAMLASDPKLRRLIESIKADRKALRAMPPDEAPRALVDDVMAGLERQMLLGEAPTDGEDVDEIAAEAQRNRMRIGPKLLRVASYTGLAAALAIAGGVVFLTVTDSPLLEQADPQKWGDTLGDQSIASRDATGRGSAESRGDALTLRDMDAVSKAGEIDAGRADKAGSNLDGSSVAMGKQGGVPTVPGTGATAGRAAAGSMAKGGVTQQKSAGQSRRAEADADAEARALHPLLTAAQTTGNQGPFALRLPEPDEANLVIEVVSDDVDDTTAGLNQWLVSNGAQIVPAELAFGQSEASVGSLKEAARRRNVSAGQADDPMTRQSAYGVVINDDQVPELLNYMNSSRAGRQVARLVEPEQPQRVALLQEEDAGERYRHGEPQYRQFAEAAAPPSAEEAPPANDPAVGLASKTANREAAESADTPQLAQTLEPDDPHESPAAAEDDRESQATRARRSQAQTQQKLAPADDEAEGVTRGPAADYAPAEAETAVEQPELKQEQLEHAPATQPAAATPETEPTEAAEPTRPDEAAAEKRFAKSDAPAGSREQDTLSETTERLLSEQVSTFDWGAVLGNQLPLAKSTPLALARRGRVVLPLVITESPTLDAAASLRETANEAEVETQSADEARDAARDAGADAEPGGEAEGDAGDDYGDVSGDDSGKNSGGANQSLEVPSDAAPAR
jgi:hypothetical protein